TGCRRLTWTYLDPSPSGDGGIVFAVAFVAPPFKAAGFHLVFGLPISDGIHARSLGDKLAEVTQ
ncbi:MAG: hypothetical protein WBE97_05515, partial [Candidatus Acidiferrales bacterium]